MWIKRTLSGAFAVALLASACFAAAPKAKAKPVTMKEGRYTAQVKAIICGACAPKILETVKGFPGIEGAEVDRDKSQLTFTVKAGSKVSFDKLQAKLKAASDDMGMGADYTLHDLKKVEKPKA